MSWLGAYELTHPESLSERQLREILKNSCIEILNFEKLCKNELLEIYKRVAMPLPQRRVYAKGSDIEVGMITEKSITTVSDETHDSSHDLNKGNKRMSYSSDSQNDRLKSINDEKSVQKKIGLYSSKVEVACKRRCNEQTEELITKKRQKITWP